MSAAEVFSINNSISCDLASGFPLFSICCSLFAPVAASVAVRLTDQNIGARVEVPPFLDCDFLKCRKQKKKLVSTHSVRANNDLSSLSSSTIDVNCKLWTGCSSPRLEVSMRKKSKKKLVPPNFACCFATQFVGKFSMFVKIAVQRGHRIGRCTL